MKGEPWAPGEGGEIMKKWCWDGGLEEVILEVCLLWYHLCHKDTKKADAENQLYNLQSVYFNMFFRIKKCFIYSNTIE